LTPAKGLVRKPPNTFFGHIMTHHPSSYRPTGRPSATHGFDDDGEPVAVTSPKYPDAPGDEVADDVARARRETIQRLVTWLCSDGADATKAGRRALAVAHHLRLEETLATQRQLAERSGCSLGAVNKATRELLPSIKALVRQP
jgi:hypothetical protein